MKIIDRWFDHSLRVMRSLVQDPPLARRVWWRTSLLVVVALAATSQRLWWPERVGVVPTLAALVLGGLAGIGALHSMARAWSYKSGWLEGRLAMVGSMAEAMNRGLSLEDWLRAEQERDLMVTFGRVPFAEDDDG